VTDRILSVTALARVGRILFDIRPGVLPLSEDSPPIRQKGVCRGGGPGLRCGYAA